MAEYYPLLARAVSSLPTSTPETRRAVYERARKALVGQLRATEPPVPEANIERENKALDDSIARLEAELAVAAALFTTEPAVSPPPLAPAPPSFAPKPIVAPTPIATPTPIVAPAAPVLRPIAPPRPPAPPDSKGVSAWPTSPKLSLPTPPGALAPPPAAAPPPPAPIPTPPAFQPPPPPIVAAQAPMPEPEPLPPSGRNLLRPRIAAEAAREIVQSPAQAEEMRVPNPPEPATVEIARPQIPSPVLPRANWRRPAVLAGVLLAVMVGVGGLAYKLRDNPSEFSRPRPPLASEIPEPPSSAKIIERIGGGPAPRTPAPAPIQPAPRPGSQVATAPTPTPVPAPTTPEAILSVGQRAALLVEAPEEAQRVRTWYGSVVWKLEAPPAGGLPVLRADVEIAEARLTASMTISRSADLKAPASHIITVRFTPGADSPVPGVSEIEPPSMRMEERPVGDPLEGRPAPVTANYFLVGLMRDAVITARNMELLKSRGWIDVPMRLSTGKIAKITFEKGPVGERLLAEALAAWQ